MLADLLFQAVEGVAGIFQGCFHGGELVFDAAELLVGEGEFPALFVDKVIAFQQGFPALGELGLVEHQLPVPGIEDRGDVVEALVGGQEDRFE